MGRTKDETNVPARPTSADASNVAVKDLKAFYDQGHSPQEVADEFNVEVEDVIRVLKLNEQGDDLDEFNQPKGAPKGEGEDTPAE